MMILRCLFLAAMPCLANAADNGRANVEWIVSSLTMQAGESQQTAIRMTHDKGWRSYWINPGESGMPTTAEWKLPDGWQSGGLQFPVPKRFVSSGLAGFGYEGTVLLPVSITAPQGFSGQARLSVKLTWLACGDEGCVPGEKEVFINLQAGTQVPTEDQASIKDAWSLLPQAHSGAKLHVEEKSDHLSLSIPIHPAFTQDLAECDVFPVTLEAINPQAKTRFRKEKDSWIAEAPLGEHAEKPIKKLELLLHGHGLEPPLLVSWAAP